MQRGVSCIVANLFSRVSVQIISQNLSHPLPSRIRTLGKPSLARLYPPDPLLDSLPADIKHSRPISRFPCFSTMTLSSQSLTLSFSSPDTDSSPPSAWFVLQSPFQREPPNCKPFHLFPRISFSRRCFLVSIYRVALISYPSPPPSPSLGRVSLGKSAPRLFVSFFSLCYINFTFPSQILGPPFFRNFEHATED